jgi:hypothetical protein
MGLKAVPLVGCLSLLCVVSVGCGSSLESATESQAAPPTQPSPQSAEAKAALRDSDSAASTVVAFWRYVGAGALPAAHELYDDRVAAVVGEGLAGGLAIQQAAAAAMELRVYDVESVAQGVLVLAEAFPEDAPRSEWSFFLKPNGRHWRIIYDTFTASGLASYAQQQVQRRIDPEARTFSAEALDAGDRAKARFRKAALTSAGGVLPGSASR